MSKLSVLLRDSLNAIYETPNIPPAFRDHMLKTLTQAYDISCTMDSILVPTQPETQATDLEVEEPMPFVDKLGKWDWNIPVSVMERMDQNDRMILEDMEAGKFELLLYVNPTYKLCWIFPLTTSVFGFRASMYTPSI